MKLQLDTENKTIKIEEAVNLRHLTETLEELLPNGKWKDFELEIETKINWNPNPIIIRERPYQPYNPHPWWEHPWITCDTNSNYEVDGNTNYTLQNGVFDVDV